MKTTKKPDKTATTMQAKRPRGRPTVYPPTVTLSLRVPITVLAQLDKYAKRAKISRNRAIGDLLQLSLNSN